MLVSRRSPRELVLTRDGKQILELFRGQHPVLDIVIDTIKVSSGFLNRRWLLKRCVALSHLRHY